MSNQENNAVKLYDIRKGGYPLNHGDNFRTLQVFKCYVCGALTNEAVMGGSCGTRLGSCCPHGHECWHHELEEKLRWLRKPHPETYKQALQQEIDNLRQQHASEIINDIVGTPNFSLEGEVTWTFSHDPDSDCEHF